MRLDRIDDPRDQLTKARRTELLAYALANGVEGVDDRSPARLLRRLLRARGLTRPPMPQRTLGFPDKPKNGQSEPVPSGESLNAEDAFLEAWRADDREAAKAPVKLRDLPADEPEDEPKSYDEMPIYTLRKLAKQRGIKSTNKWRRTDFIPALEALDRDQDTP